MGWKDKVKSVADKGQEAFEQARAAQEQRKEDQEVDREKRGVLFQSKSHEEGRNAIVTLYGDRIERVKEKSRASLSRARQDTEVTPLRSVSVQAKKEGLLWTRVTVFASGNNIDFRFGHDEAQEFKDQIQKLLLDPASSGASATAATQPPDPLDQLKKLGELRESGLISSEEFEAKKKQLLGL